MIYVLCVYPLPMTGLDWQTLFKKGNCPTRKVCVSVKDPYQNRTVSIATFEISYTDLLCNNSPIYDECQTQNRFRRGHENGFIKTIQTISHNLYLSDKLTSLYCGLRLIQAHPSPFSKGTLTRHSPIGCGVLFQSSWWPRFHGSAKTYADWVWHSL